MLLGIPKIISPELLKVLAEMGHGDEITIADANFPGTSMGKPVIRMDGHDIPNILRAVLQLFPLDDYVDHPLSLMAVPDGMNIETPIWDVYMNIAQEAGHCADMFEEVERFAFYDRVRAKSVAVIMTGETALNANLILKKGVVR